jgi:hypothetical protein
MKPILLTLLGGASLAYSAIEVTVPPGGSLTAARDAIRAKRQAGETGAAVILLKSGTYEVTGPLLLEAQDSNLAIRAAQEDKPLLIGSTPIKNFIPHQGKILKADVTEMLIAGVSYRQLLSGGERMILARYPNFTPEDPLYGGWAFVSSHPPGGTTKNACLVKADDVRKWEYPEDVEVDIMSGLAWWNSIVPLSSLDPETRLLTLAKPASYEILPYNRFRFQNALEELDAPGEWFLDPRTRILYFWPLSPSAITDTRLVTLESFIQITAGAKNIRIERLSFTGCNGTAINLANAEDCLIAGCTLTTVGGYRSNKGDSGGGISINGGRRNIVTGNDISYIGGAGIGISGGDCVTLTPALHQATNNDIHHVGVFARGSSGIDVGGCGVRIANNLIHDSPRIGVQMGGNKHVVEYNHLHHLCLETNDGGALYTGGRNWLGGRGTIWRYNLIHDIIGCDQTAAGLKRPAFVFGLYPDDNTGGLDIIGNLVYRIGCTPIHMHNSRDCLLENNIFAYGTSHQFDLHGWTKTHSMFTGHFPTMVKGYESVAGQTAWTRMRGMALHPKDAIRADGTIMSGNILRRNIMISNSPEAKYCDVRNATSKWNTIDGNLAWNGGHPVKTGTGDWAAWQAAGWDKNSIVADPLFGNPEADDFRLKAASPAITKLGFKPLPVEKMGLIRDQWRK